MSSRRIELPEEKGTYILIASLSQLKRIEIGRLGKFEFIPGYYAYVGSAFGTGGLWARIGHHLESTAAPHWHIDFLLQQARLTEVWFTTADRKLERHWAELLDESPQFRVPIAHFGSSDYHRSRASHLFFSKRAPSFRLFREMVKAHLVEWKQSSLCSPGPVPPAQDDIYHPERVIRRKSTGF